ncbi:YbhN family protein [Lichenihabitans sp. Uapishka_5]|uniref:lysylphosphatidylglycerol synthase transmembrane domain-containing protein n=1 Tax=Lichenihabitans sp. Uapishka_5 TaxID=3037302 RepID=UPI0029E7E4FF|nr:YbhN family protein [Lichenihabitans sp. Uapishka_5]MDX7951648.1 YbhN family protein [Lichenihabitans sp. Uapishka_5]
MRPQPTPARRTLDFLWPAVGIVAVLLSCWLLSRELSHLSWADLRGAVGAIPAHRWILAVGCTILAYAALAWYDRIALMHLGFRFSWPFISAVSFTTYALSHNIGMSMFSGAMVRYRAYSTRGLSLPDVGIMTAFCSFTFGLGTVLLGGLVCLAVPQPIVALFALPSALVRLLGLCGLIAAGLYLAGSALRLKPVVLRGIRLEYPRPGVVARQIVAGPLELIGAAGIIYCALPVEFNPGFPVVLGIFLASFSAALLSHAPGGLGVLELVFLAGMPEVPKADVLAALLVFRLLYLIIPLVLGILAVVAFERNRLACTLRGRNAA